MLHRKCSWDTDPKENNSPKRESPLLVLPLPLLMLFLLQTLVALLLLLRPPLQTEPAQSQPVQSGLTSSLCENSCGDVVKNKQCTFFQSNAMQSLIRSPLTSTGFGSGPVYVVCFCTRLYSHCNHNPIPPMVCWQGHLCVWYSFELMYGCPKTACGQESAY